MERAAEEEALRAKVKLLREAIHSSKSIHKEAAVVGASLKNHKAAIDEAIRPAKKRTYMACRVHDNIRRSLTAAGTIVRHLELVREAEQVILLDRSSKDLNAYLEVVEKLRSAKRFSTSKRRCRAGNNVHERVNELLSKAVHDLDNEFRRLLTKCSKPVELGHIFNYLPTLNQQLPSENLIGPSANDYSEAQLNRYAECPLPTLVDPCYLTLLSKLAQKSVQLDFHQKFLKIYSEIRASTLEQSLKYLGVEYVTKEEVQQVQAESLEPKTSQWNQSFRITVKLLFGAERMLCDHVFEGKYMWKHRCFAEVTAKSLSTLLSFGEAVVQSQTSPDKVPTLLDMYEATLKLQPEVEAIFEGNECSESRKSALTLTKRLAQTTKKTLDDFMENVVNHSVTSTTIDGAVHPLTNYVIDYIKFLFDNQASLKKIFGEPCVGDGKDNDMISQIVGVIHALETNLDIKAKQYEDPALGHLFLMNNTHYIVKSIYRLEAKYLFGADWIERRRRIVQQQATQYRRVAWRKVWECLSTQGLASPVGSSTNVTQGSFGNINTSTTSRSVIKERPLIENSHSALKYMKYTPESLEQALCNLFAKKLLLDEAIRDSDCTKASHLTISQATFLNLICTI